MFNKGGFQSAFKTCKKIKITEISITSLIWRSVTDGFNLFSNFKKIISSKC